MSAMDELDRAASSDQASRRVAVRSSSHGSEQPLQRSTLLYPDSELHCDTQSAAARVSLRAAQRLELTARRQLMCARSSDEYRSTYPVNQPSSAKNSSLRGRVDPAPPGCARASDSGCDGALPSTLADSNRLRRTCPLASLDWRRVESRARRRKRSAAESATESQRA